MDSDSKAQDKRIENILGQEQTDKTPITLKIYSDYLRENIRKPCIVTGIEDFQWEEVYVLGPGSQAEYKELKKTRPSYTDRFEIIKFEDINEWEGIMVRVRRLSDNKRFSLPLADLKAVDRDSKNCMLLHDYAVWCVNF